MNKINYLLALSNPLFSLANDFQNDPDKNKLDHSSFKANVVALLDNFERAAFEKSQASQQVQEVKYALCALLDEVIVSSDWQSRHEWMGQPLQLQFFGEHTAGTGFFQHLKLLRMSGHDNINLLEVYYVCLQFGFEGKYRMQGSEQWQALQVDLRSQINSIRGILDPKLSADAIPTETLVNKVSREVPFWAIASLACALVFTIYLGYSIAIERQSHHALKNINAALASVEGTFNAKHS